MKKQFPILLIDDDPDLLSIINQVAPHAFPEAIFTQVYTTAEAMTYLNGLHGSGPKLILLDIYFRDGVNGFGLLTRLRTNPKTRPIPVVMLTGIDSHQDVMIAYSDGASSFTVKPTVVSDWMTYLKTLRLYWFQTVTLP